MNFIKKEEKPMQTKENLSQTVKDVKVEIIKEELLDAIEEGVRKFVRTTLEVYAKDVSCSPRGAGQNLGFPTLPVSRQVGTP